MAKLPDDLEPMEEETVRRIAKIIGDGSAASAALKALEAKREEGLNPVIGYSRRHGCFIVADIGRN